ncbi:MAG: hypothetical protein HOH74_07495, partial [Gemmatimonadetes bacterium]|nr:hypothetical protein [Gemmatimonadota bacterium]
MVLILLYLIVAASLLPAAGQSMAYCARPAAGSAARVAQAAPTLPSAGQLHALVLFGTFADDTGRSAAAPAWADSLFLSDLPGSLSHFFDEMSHSQYRLTGAAAPGMYRSRQDAFTYTAAVVGQARGDFGRFVEEIIEAADADIDFGTFDNDGPDGEPNSGDDDGFVDALFVVVPEMPSGFLVSDANGLAVLGLPTPVSTDDLDPHGARIRIRQDTAPGAASGGAIQEGRSFAGTVGIIAHEHGHLLGLPDLFDTGFLQGADSGPAEDSAGIGYWGLMGHGARGWGDLGGPTLLSAWSLAQLGWLGIDNAALRPADTTSRDVRLEDSNADGLVYRVPILGRQYLLVEHRRASGSFYDRHLPADGVLIWHVNESVSSNNTEAAKLVDLVCADGRFADAGFPEGTEHAPVNGDDNLDFWAHDARYRSAHAGNLGDATDVFDGLRYTEFTPVTNPASRNVAVERIRRDGESMVVDLIVGDRRKAGVLVENETWSGIVDVVADVEIPEGIGLRIAAGTTVRFLADAREGGRDPQRSELQVEGVLSVGGGVTTTLTSGADLPAAGDWAGIRVLKSGEIRLIDVVVEYAVDAVRIVDATQAVLLEDVVVRHSSGDGIHLASDDAGHGFTRVTVEDVAGTGMLLTGEAPVFLEELIIRRCGGLGLHRSLGAIQCSDGEFTDNGQGLPVAINALLEDGVFGTVKGNTFRGGTGLKVVDVGQLQIEENLFRDTQVALHHRTGMA